LIFSRKLVLRKATSPQEHDFNKHDLNPKVAVNIETNNLNKLDNKYGSQYCKETHLLNIIVLRKTSSPQEHHLGKELYNSYLPELEPADSVCYNDAA
jgi:hypothetical protein